jgi:hypothetical protein
MDPTLPLGDAWGIIGARLKEGFTVQQLQQAAEGAKLDEKQWAGRANFTTVPFLYGSASQVHKFLKTKQQGLPIERSKTGYNAEDMYAGRAPPGRIVITDEMAPWRTAK